MHARICDYTVHAKLAQTHPHAIILVILQIFCKFCLFAAIIFRQ